tara:strand:- start:73 stop:792 length:720 start_codon:yes stop_codon:yes gene_type:complete
MSNLGLLDLCDNDTEKAKSIIKEQGIVYCFRAGWAKYAELKKISASYFDDISITQYALGINDISDIRVMHQALVKEGQQSARLLQIYKNIGAKYSANSLIIDHDEDVLVFELQKFLNSAVALLLIDSDKKVFTNTLYQQFIALLTDTEKGALNVKLEGSIAQFTEQLPASTKEYLQTITLLDFNDLMGLIKQPANAAIYAQDILELPMTVSNELNNDFDGGYDFHADDDDDIAYLRPDG